MRIISISILLLMLALTSTQVQAFQETEWYWIYHASGCVPLSEMYKEFPYFKGARTPQDMLEKVRDALPNENKGFYHTSPIHVELKPFVEFIEKTPDAYQSYKDPRINKANAIGLVVRDKPQDFVLIFFRGDLCKVLRSY